MLGYRPGRDQRGRVGDLAGPVLGGPGHAPDPEGGEVVVAAVALSDDVNEEELMHYCRNQLAEYKVPRRIAVLDRLPRGNSGKIKLRIEDVT